MPHWQHQTESISLQIKLQNQHPVFVALIRISPYGAAGNSSSHFHYEKRPIHLITKENLQNGPVSTVSTEARRRASVELVFVLQWNDT